MFTIFLYIFFSTNKKWQLTITKKTNKEKLQKEAREAYQNSSEEEKDKRRQYARERNRNLSDEEKEKKYQYGLERHQKFLEDEYRKFFSRIQEIKIV